MSSRVLLLACLAACTGDSVTTVEAFGFPGRAIPLRPEYQDTEPSDATYRWVVAAGPTNHHAALTSGMPTASFEPDVRGVYAVERWLRLGVSEDLTHRFVVGIQGIPPMPVVRGPSQVAIGANVMIDASDSVSPEGRPLSFVWRLSVRPRDSQATLADLSAETTTFTADVAGAFLVELAAFDGELWSEPHATFNVAAQ